MITLFKDPLFDVFDKVFETSHLSVQSPQVKVRRNDNNYKVFLSVPGLTKEEIKITTKENVLTISFQKDEKSEKLYFVNDFKKSYTLPDDVQEKDIEGKVQDGILELTLPIDKKKSLERLISLN